MTTAPPIAHDRLVGLAGVSDSLVRNMELKHRIPPRMPATQVDAELTRIIAIITQLSDRDLFGWLDKAGVQPTVAERHRAASVVADRLCGAETNPNIRNAQEHRQLAIIKDWLQAHGYSFIGSGERVTASTMPPGSFSQRINVPGELPDGRSVNVPIDTAIMPMTAQAGEIPLLIEAKSAGDYTNTNKRRKEEKAKFDSLRRKYGLSVRFVLFLCGYFDSGYLGYEAAEGMDWVWEHRVDDLAKFGV
jgi:hypothetical protein